MLQVQGRLFATQQANESKTRGVGARERQFAELSDQEDGRLK